MEIIKQIMEIIKQIIIDEKLFIKGTLRKSNFNCKTKESKIQNTERENELYDLTERLHELEIQNLQKTEVFNPTL